LTQHPVSVCISDLVSDVEKFAVVFEKMVADAYLANPALQARFASDVTTVVKIELGTA
jgi:hypothetical protein